MKIRHTRFAILSIGLFGLPLMLPAGTASAQYRLIPSIRPGSSGASSEAAAPATTRDPRRVRTQLMAVHGFSRASLEAASTEVSAILRGFITDPDELMLVRRQAVKALRLFPDDANFAFIRDNVGGAPEGLQRLYLHSLGAYTGARDGQVDALLAPLLGSGAVGVRHAAAGLSHKVGLSGGLRSALNARLAEERDPSVRSAIQKALNR